MTPTKRAVLAHSSDPHGLIVVARDICAAASAVRAAGHRRLARTLVDEAEEVLEIRAAMLDRRRRRERRADR